MNILKRANYRDDMSVPNTMILFALLVAFTWIILYEVTVVVYNNAKNQPCKLKITPKPGTVIMKSDNDTTNYKNENKSDCFCEKVRCLRKCCSEKEIFRNNTCQPDVKNRIFSDHFPYYIMENVSFDQICPTNWKKQVISLRYFNYSIGSEGTLLFEKEELPDYCMIRNEIVLICEPDSDTLHVKFGFMISVPFLLVTFMVYLLLPETSNHKRAVINYVFSLLCGYISILTLQIVPPNMSPPYCYLFAYSRIFFLLASFFWLNAICIEMWITFSGPRRNSGRKKELNEFVTFCIYAWGMPSLFILTTVLLNTYADKDAIFHPRIGEGKCAEGDGYPSLFYFYLPIAILVTINVTLCMSISLKILRVRKETRVFERTDSKRHCYEDDKRKFNLYVKLTLAMGVNWSLEVISWLVMWRWKWSPRYIWYATDFTNAAYGVCIFLIFVFNKSIWLQLKKRYYMFRGKAHLALTVSPTRSTNNISPKKSSWSRSNSELQRERPEEMSELSTFKGRNMS